MRVHRFASTALASALVWTLHACILDTAGIPGAGVGGSTTSTSSTASVTTTGAGGGSTTSAGGGATTGGIDPDPTCADGLKNGLETGVDCGGDACAPCGPGGACTGDADCITHACVEGACAAMPVDPGCEPSDQPTCNDCLTNGGETDIDCGGDACPPCGVGAGCMSDADCATLVCTQGACVDDPVHPGCEPSDDLTCNDCVTSGTETDIDCGGDACLPCGAGLGCVLDADCLSASCLAGTCAPGVGGQPCRGVTDCAGGQCVAGGCWTGSCCQ